jgi:pSer/pThr/pTyr-binding forkhead associated (FHA) protein
MKNLPPDLNTTFESAPPGTRQVFERFQKFDRILSSLPIEPEGPALVYEVPEEGRADFVLLTLDEVRVGRKPIGSSHPDDCHVAFPSQKKLSSRHFRITKDGEEFILDDLGSKNGTYVNDGNEPIKNRILRSGDLIEAGGITFAFVGALQEDLPD